MTHIGENVLVITGDHSTPSQMKGHSWHPVPFLLQSAWCRPDEVLAFGERMVARGIHGRIPASSLMGLMLAHGLRLAKFGA
jgi:2,3-bisphosphoglycerate-independent phosphoglycerate mutase